MKRILVVDDDFGIAEALNDLLSDEGFAVTVVRNGKDALRRIEEHKPDIIVLDYMMPVMDGRDVLKTLANDPDTCGIPVVMMSAVPRASLPADCNPAGFLRKPFDIDALIGLINRLLGRA